MALSGREMLVKQIMSMFGLDRTLTEGLMWSIETVQQFDSRLANIEGALSILIRQQQAKTVEVTNGRPALGNGQAEISEAAAADHA